MKKSFMINLKNFVDSNVRHRIDRVAHNSGNINNTGEPPNDELLLVERHFDDIQLFCVDAEKKISSLLQSIQISPTTQSNLGTYTQNVQAGFNNISQNIAQQAANITSSASTISGLGGQPTHDNNFKNSAHKEYKSTLTPIQCSSQYRSSESLGKSRQDQASHIQRSTNSNLPNDHGMSEDVLVRYKKLPIVGFYKFMSKSSRKLKQDSLLGITLTHYSQLQAQLTNLYLTYEQMIDSRCLKTIQHMLETDIPNVLKLKKYSLKAHHDLESLRSKYNGANQKQQQTSASGHFTNTSYLISQNSVQQGNKLEQLKNELDDAVTRFEQARDVYETELFGFVCKEPELVNLVRLFYELEAEFHQRVSLAIRNSTPSFSETLACTPRKFAFGTPLEEHIRCTGRTISPVIELCAHFLHLQALREEGLFRIPGSSIKIKKLRNGINAWFVTLMNLDELDGGRLTGRACITALYDLFRNAVGQRPQERNHQSDSSDPPVSISIAGGEDSTLGRRMTSPDAESFQTKNNNDDYILDVHSIAGLLKLYLRELPEPLFTHALYDNWIACISSDTDSSTRVEWLAKVMEQLPRPNYENLRHLVKFLHHLTSFQEQNKMSSTNLAIAMAPSLIWSRPLDHEGTQLSSGILISEDAQSLNLQISSFGMSASQHAVIIETLINNADQLFPGPCDYTLSEFVNLTLKCKKGSNANNMQARLGRSTKSTSPTGLSTASSSSFSSNASNSTASFTAIRGHNRKGGSMDGLLGGPEDIKSVVHNMSVRSIGRPVSVQIRHNDYSSLSRQSQASSSIAGPLKPPVPNARSHSRPNPTGANHNPKPPPSNKVRAPPVPPPTSVRHHQERMKASCASASDQEGYTSRPVSLRGTGTINAGASGQQQRHGAVANQTLVNTKARPSVPPPERPATSPLVSEARKAITTAIIDRNCKSVDDFDTKSSHSLTSSGNMCGNFEEISVNEVDEIDLSTQSNSPVVSLDSISGDSSFDNDNDNTSLDRSWTKCFTAEQTTACNESECDYRNRSGTLKSIVHDTASAAPPDTGGTSKSIIGDGMQGQSDNRMSDQRPAKPPRSVSPKITQSTPL